MIMNFSNPRINLLIVAIVLLVGLGGDYFLSKNNSVGSNKVINPQATTTQETLISSQQSEIENLKKEIEALKKRPPTTVTKTIPRPESNFSTLIEYWKPRVVHIECHFQNKVNPNNNLTSSGSGLYMGAYYDDPGFLKVLTNAHVIALTDGPRTATADFCYLQLTDDSDVMISSNFSSGSGWARGTDFSQDVAMITISNPTSHLKNIKTKTQFCLEPGSIGDELIVLGYPSIGSSEEVTVTRGIISSYEGYYYITDAKIDHGNSGGIAILAKSNCNLGIPTAVVSGEIESLGRILDGGTALSWLAH